MAEIQGTGHRMLPLHVPQGRPQVRTKNPRRPAWLDSLRRPLQIVAANERQFERFRDMWRFDQSECRHVLLTKDIQGMPISIPLLCLPNSFDPSPTLIEDFCPVRMWKSIGGVCIDVPDSAMYQPFEFSLEDNMAASTLVAIAQHRHLDSLNQK